MTAPADAPDILTLSLAYAKAGWYVFPVQGSAYGDPDDGMTWKKPAFKLIESWQKDSTTDPAQIAAWFAGTKEGIGVAVDCGGSGLVVLDGDRRDDLIAWAGETNLRHGRRLQGNPDRCSWVFRLPAGAFVPSQVYPWGEVKAAGGYVLLPPSPHKEGGAYRWLDRGMWPGILPPALVERLTKKREDVRETAGASDVAAFMATVGASRPEVLDWILTKASDDLARVGQRHPVAKSILPWAVEEIAAGHIPARTTIATLRQLFQSYPSDHPFSDAEFDDLLAWAIGQASGNGPSRAAATAQRVGDVMEEFVPDAAEEPWPQPVDPSPALPPPIDVSMLPPVLADMVTATAAQAQAPVEVPLAAALAVLSAATRGAWEVDLGDGWTEQTAVYTLALVPSGERKTSAFRPVTAPLTQFEEAEEIRERAERHSRDAEAAALVGKAKAAQKDGDARLYGQLMAQADLLDYAEPHLILVDATPEALGVHMHEQRGPAAIFCTEANAFTSVAGGYSEGRANLGLLNAAYDAEPYADKRIKRTSVKIKRTFLAWGSAVQPDVLGKYATSQTEGSGFLARFTMFAPSSLVGTRQAGGPAIPEPVAHAWETAVRRVATAGKAWHGDYAASGCWKTPWVARLTPEAAQRLRDYFDELEPRKSKDLSGMVPWTEKHHGRVARISALFALLRSCDKDIEVNMADVENGIALGEQLVAHAKTAHRAMRASVDALPEQRLLAAIRDLTPGEDPRLVSTREVYRRVEGQSWCDRRTEAVRDAMAGLVEMGWLRGPYRRTPGIGGRPSQVWVLHPALRDRGEDL